MKKIDKHLFSIFLVMTILISCNSETQEFTNSELENALLTLRNSQSPGQIHNEVCEFLLGKNNEISNYSNLNDQFNFIKNLIYQKYSIMISIETLVDRNGNLIQYSVMNSSSLNQEEKLFIKNVYIIIENFNWQSSTILQDLENEFNNLDAQIINSQTMQNKDFMLEILSIARHSTFLWHNQITSGQRHIPDFPCLFGAIADDVDYYSSACGDIPGDFCPFIAGIYSYHSYTQCAN